MLRPGSPLSRSVALLLMLAAMLAAYRFALLPVMAAYSRARATIVQTEALLQRYHALAEERTRLADQVSAYERLVADSGAYLTGSNEIQAAAALQERAQAAIERAHGEVRSIQVLPVQAVRAAKSVRRIAVKLQFTIDINSLRDVLYALETDHPYLFIEELGIKRSDRSNSSSVLEVSMTIEGYTNGGTRDDTVPDSRSATLRG